MLCVIQVRIAEVLLEIGVEVPIGIGCGIGGVRLVQPMQYFKIRGDAVGVTVVWYLLESIEPAFEFIQGNDFVSIVVFFQQGAVFLDPLHPVKAGARLRGHLGALCLAVSFDAIAE